MMQNKYELFIIDVDGTMTDAGIYYDEQGNELKKFCTKDAAAFFAIHAAGGKIMVLTGRECMATLRRMKELKVDYIFQNVKNKASFIRNFSEENAIPLTKIAFIGDDLNDLESMQLVGYVACPKDSCKEVKKSAHYISEMKGGAGAVRDIVEHMYEKMGIWKELVNKIYVSGI